MGRLNKPKSFHYLAHQCSEADSGIILNVNATGGDVQDCERCVEEYKYLKDKMRLPAKSAGLDSGYDTIAIHFCLSRLGIKAFIHPYQRGIRKNNDKIPFTEFIWDREQYCYTSALILL